MVAEAKSHSLFFMMRHFALSALQDVPDHNPGRCPGLLHFAPLALEAQVLLHAKLSITGSFSLQ